MNPIKNECWSCERCQKTFRYDENGKIQAEQCCKCAECKTVDYMTYVGVSVRSCKRCCLERDIKSGEDRLKGSVDFLNSAKQEYKDLMKRNK